jgi:glycosyltransferase involved in cell wall biosynthesis
MPRALIVSTASPYPVVTNGCARLVSDYERRMFAGYDTWFLSAQPGSWAPASLFNGGQPAGADLDVDALVARQFQFVLFIGFGDNRFMRSLAAAIPSFCLSDTFPHPDVPPNLFRGILAHRAEGRAGADGDVLLVGGTFDDEVFRPARAAEDIVLSVGRIHPDKGQLELVASYREQVFEQYGLPLHLVGGADDRAYCREVANYVDGVSVVSRGWRSAEEIADLCNRARLFISASPAERFGMALVEAMACGTTCVVDGTYSGFAEADLRRHVHGNITGRKGVVTELAAKALADDVRIDASDWAMQYSLRRTRPAVAQFIDERL